MTRTYKLLIHVSLFSAALLVAVAASSRDLVDSSASPQTMPMGRTSSGVENLLRGTKYENLIDEYRNQYFETDKGFFPLLGNYFEPATVGWGLDIQAIGNTIFAVWFTYLANGEPYWYIIVGDLETKGGGGSITGNIESFKWDPGGAPGSQATATIVGQMTIDWSDESNADVSWTLDGVPGDAEVEIIQFSPDPALTDMTGHYFPFFAGGWGLTLLTQGQVTVMTMYWYKDGQPVWAQGVAPVWGLNPTIELLYFNGPGLCPACLSQKGGGLSTTSLAFVLVNWGFDIPPLVNLSTGGIFAKGGPLGPNPFGDIPLGFGFATTQGITSAVGDNFDPQYAWFGNSKGPDTVRRYEFTFAAIAAGSSDPPFFFAFEPYLLPPAYGSVLANPETGAVIDIPFPAGKGGGCVAFEYDTGIVFYPPERTGNMATAYLMTGASGADGDLPVYSNSTCTTPLEMQAAGVLTSSRIRISPTGEGYMFRWSAPVGSVVKSDDDDDDGGSG